MPIRLQVQHGVQKSAERDTLKNRESLASTRSFLRERLRSWRDMLPAMMPQVHAQAKESSAAWDENPEDYEIVLPSSFSQKERKDLELENLGLQELEIRMTEARSALSEVRYALKRYAFGISQKRSSRSQRGQGATTRMEGRIRSFRAEVEKAAKSYREIYKLLVQLGFPSDDLRFQPLLDSHLSGSRQLWRELALGQGRSKIPWIWTTQLGKEQASSSAWSIEGKRRLIILMGP